MRRITRIWTGAAAALAVTPVLSLAAWAATEEPTKEGMPQLNFANPLTISQVVWMFILFALLYVLVSRWALPQVADVIEARQTRIAGDLETARTAKAEADSATTEVTASIHRAQAEAQGRIAASVAQAKEAAAAQAHSLNERLEAQLAESEARIAQARTAAMGALRQVAAETAGAVVARLTGQVPSPQDVDAAIGQAMAARGQA